MNSIKVLAFILSVISYSSFCLGNINFKQKLDSSWFYNETQINYKISDNNIGFISYTKIPLMPVYVIHSFYIYPNFRNKGYGRELILYAINQLKLKNFKKIYIQPGPFELKDGQPQYLDQKNYEISSKKLMAFYKSVGFNYVNRWLSQFICLLYKIVGISENADYLMVV